MTHPALRIAALFALAAACASVDGAGAAALAGATILCALALGAGHALAGLLHRARWLLLSVLLLDAFATPGPAAWAAGPAWAPSAAGLALALHRGAALLTMLAAVAALLQRTAVPELVRGIAALAAPLRPFGVDPDRLGRRLGGALAELAGAEAALRSVAARDGWLAALAARIAAIEGRAAG